MIPFLVSALSIATVLLYGCVGEIITEKAGHLNLGIPGIMPFHNIKAGDVVDVTGEFRVEPRKVRGKADGFEFIIDIHNITPVDDAFEDYRLTETDKEMIIELSKRDDIYDLLCNTLAPEIYGHETVKEGLILQLFDIFLLY